MTALAEPTTAPADAEAPPATLPGWLLRQAADRPKQVAIRVKELGRWREISWAEYADRVQSVGRALLFQGVKPGDRVALASDNRVEWLIADLAVQGLGAVTVGVSVLSDGPELVGMLEQTGSKVILVEDEEQFDKVMESRDRLSLDRVVVIDPRGIERLDDPASSYEALEALGSLDAVRAREADVDAWRNTVNDLDPNAVATIVFTPGTAQEPRGVRS